MTPSLQEYNKIRATLSLITAGQGETGLLPTVAIRRLSDGLWLQNGGGSWAAGFAVNDMLEVDAVNVPGAYEYAVPESMLSYEDGLDGYLLVLQEDTLHVYEHAHVATKRDMESLITLDPSLEGDYTVTVKQGATPISGATVRVFNSIGTTLVARGVTDAQGEVDFPLPVGQYQVRVNKDGYDFSDINPSTITVLPNDNVTPRIDEILPDTGSIGDTLGIIGQFFHETGTEVEFGVEATVAADFISADLTTLLVTVPVGLTATAIPVRVRKPDPDNVGQYLYSPVSTFTRV